MISKTEFLQAFNNQRQKCLIFTRCMGYYRPTKDFNQGKQAEFAERVFYKIK